MIHVVVGLIFNSEGEILVAQRQLEKFQGGRWEFPGGKVETDEAPLHALQRELYEEIGIEILQAKAWEQFRFEYADRKILLDVWHVTEFRGEAQGKEGQAIRWVSRAVLPTLEIPDANWEIVKRLGVAGDFF